MKIEWQPEDIQAGRRVGHPERIEQWIIGYMGAAKSDEPRWVLVSLSDGMVMVPITKEELCAKLNTMGDLPLELVPSANRARSAKGGKARAAALTPERRSEIASAAGNARWNGNITA